MARFVALAALLAVLGACAPFLSNGQDSPFDRNQEPDLVQLEILNNHFSDARVSVLWEGATENLGVVSGKSKQVFELPRRSHQVRVRVSLLAASRFTTEPLSTQRDARLYLVIPSNL